MCRFALLSAPCIPPLLFGHSNLSPPVSFSRITGLASSSPGRTAYLLPTQLHDCFAYALRYTLHASLAFAYNHSCMPCILSIISCRFVSFIFFSWCLLFQSSITLKFTFSWLLRGQFSISLGSVLQVPPSPLYSFQQLLVGGNDFFLILVPARSRRFFGS